MPYSMSTFDKIVKSLIGFLEPKRVLDIGAGAGKYGEMVREVNPDAKSVAVEIEPSYIEKFKLNEIYDEVWQINACDLINPDYFEKVYDLVIIGDMIEHMVKSDGIDLVNFLMYRSKWVVIVYPDRYLQNSVDGNHHEAHISVWGERDFANFEKCYVSIKRMRLIVLKGFLEKRVSISKIKRFILLKKLFRKLMK